MLDFLIRKTPPKIGVLLTGIAVVINSSLFAFLLLSCWLIMNQTQQPDLSLVTLLSNYRYAVGFSFLGLALIHFLSLLWWYQTEVLIPLNYYLRQLKSTKLHCLTSNSWFNKFWQQLVRADRKQLAAIQQDYETVISSVQEAETSPRAALFLHQENKLRRFFKKHVCLPLEPVRKARSTKLFWILFIGALLVASCSLIFATSKLIDSQLLNKRQLATNNWEQLLTSELTSQSRGFSTPVDDSVQQVLVNQHHKLVKGKLSGELLALIKTINLPLDGQLLWRRLGRQLYAVQVQKMPSRQSPNYLFRLVSADYLSRRYTAVTGKQAHLDQWSFTIPEDEKQTAYYLTSEEQNLLQKTGYLKLNFHQQTYFLLSLPVYQGNQQIISHLLVVTPETSWLPATWQSLLVLLPLAILLLFVVLIYQWRTAKLAHPRTVSSPLSTPAHLPTQKLQDSPSPQDYPLQPELAPSERKRQTNLLHLLQQKVARSQAGMEQYQRLSNELNLVREMQQSLLPPSEFHNSWLSCASHSTAAGELSGDFYDRFALDEDHWCCLIGDASGKSMSGALFGTLAKTLLREALQLEKHDLVAACRKVNRILGQQNHLQMFVTLLAIVINLRTGELLLLNAGHPPPFWLPTGKQPVSLGKSNNLPLGLRSSLPNRVQSLQLAVGDSLVLFTDGLFELEKNHRQLGRVGLRRIVAKLDRSLPPQQMLDVIYQQLASFQGDHPWTDDATCVIVNISGFSV